MSETPPIVLGAVRITEPATMITDFVIAGLCGVFGVGVAREAAFEGHAATGLWALSFASTAAAAAFGAVFHGFTLHLGAAAKQRLWKATQYALGFTSLAMLCAAVVAFVPRPASHVGLGVAVAKFAVYAVVARRRDDYTVVVLDYGTSMIAVASLGIVGWARVAAPAAPWLVAGVAVSAVAAAVQLKRVAPHPRFNHNDLYHVVKAAALYVFYRGGLLLVDA